MDMDVNECGTYTEHFQLIKPRQIKVKKKSKCFHVVEWVVNPPLHLILAADMQMDIMYLSVSVFKGNCLKYGEG